MQAFYHHIYSVSHLQKTSNLASTSEPASTVSAAPKSSFPMDSLYASNPFSSSPVEAHDDEYGDMSYDVQSTQWMQASRQVINNSSRKQLGEIRIISYLHSLCRGD